MVFGLKFVFLEFVLLFKGLHDFWVVSNVKKSCCVLLCSSSCFGVGGASVSIFLKCPIYFLIFVIRFGVLYPCLMGLLYN